MFKYYITFAFLLLLAACGGGGGGVMSNSLSESIPDPSVGSVTNANLRPAVPSSLYASVLVRCVEAGSQSLCSQATLPLLGANGNVPSKSDVLAQTVVQTGAQAQRFSVLLDEMPSDIYRLFRGVTAVVIDNISPSYYSGSTGAIYLDASFLDNQEPQKITTYLSPQFDEGGNVSLRFRTVTAIVDADYATTANRSAVVNLGQLLFHELAHANDFIPPDQLSRLNQSYTIFQQVDAFEAEGVYVGRVGDVYPLTDSLLSTIADSLYGVGRLTSEATSLSAYQIGARFANDGANDLYSYYSDYEDVGMLAEEALAKYYFNVDRALAFTDKPSYSGSTCASYIVRWGVLNRIGDMQVKNRVRVILKRLLGEADVEHYLSALPGASVLTYGNDVCHAVESLVY